MTTNFVSLDTTKALDDWIARSNDAPVIVYKHSTECPISRAAHREMERLGGDVGIVTIQQSPDVSREVEQRTGLEHHTPQTIIMRNGQAVWSATHYDIKFDGVEQAMRQNE